jgi:predicted transposase YbfD/YdcC
LPLRQIARRAARLYLPLVCAAARNEITAIPELLDHLAETKQLEGALVTIDAMGCQIAIADKIVEHKADYLLALKGNQPTLEAQIADYFNSAPAEELVVKDAEIEKGHGRIGCDLHRFIQCRLDHLRQELPR